MKKKKPDNQRVSDNEKLLKEQLARALADYDNFRKRVEREKNQIEMLANARLILKLLSVFDMLEEAQDHLADAGIGLTLEEFNKILKEEGVERIEAEPGTGFDEKLHEVVETVDVSKKKGAKPGEIAEEVLSGWQVNKDLVIRPTKVKVYKENK